MVLQQDVVLVAVSVSPPEDAAFWVGGAAGGGPGGDSNSVGAGAGRRAGPGADGPLQCPLAEHEVRAALVDHVKRRCCYGTGAAKNMAITALNHSSAFQVSYCDGNTEKP